LPDGLGDDLRSAIGQTGAACAYQKVRSQLLLRAEQIENIALLIADMHTTLRLLNLIDEYTRECLLIRCE
jgi:hypothetical protein